MTKDTLIIKTKGKISVKAEQNIIEGLAKADKFSRTNNPEVYSNLASYWAWEKHRGQEREVGIREFMERFPKEGQYNLKYGFIFSSHSQQEENKVLEDQKEENEEEKKLEKEKVEVIEQKSKMK
ncbi:1179_t:CDS:2 [Paraglomus brasilianum]|uniref:1179_t:CDS:1 n=1 Tax=Paraglomus brasilianum TaxID=144538 RepID=A0A9N9B1U2_9GLOM|nr:1179_t:CDS:2 [Paraglomus brasilianum]